MRRLPLVLGLLTLFSAAGPMTGKTHAGPILMISTYSVVHNGGFGGPVHSYRSSNSAFLVVHDGGVGGEVAPPGPFFNLGFDPNPTGLIHSTILGTSPQESDGAIGGSDYFDPTISEVILANGSFLSQYAPDHSHDPATATIGWDSLTRVDNWSNIMAEYIARHVSGVVGTGGYVKFNLDVHWDEFIGYAHDGGGGFFGYITDTRDIGSLSLGGEYLISQPGPFDVSFFQSRPLADVSLAPWEGEGYIRMFGTLTVTVMDPEGETSVAYSLNSGSGPVPEPASIVMWVSGALVSACFACTLRRKATTFDGSRDSYSNQNGTRDRCLAVS
jgi:hypothetical protein